MNSASGSLLLSGRIGVCLLAWSVAVQAQAAKAPLELHLEEVRAHALDSGDVPTRIMVSPAGRTVVTLGSGSVVLLVGANSEKRSFESELLQGTLTGFTRDDGTLELIDTAASALVATTQGRRPRVLARFPVDFKVHDAVKTESGWTVGGYQRDSVYRIVSGLDRGNPNEVFSINGSQTRFGIPVRLASDGPNVLVTSVDSPFVIRLVQRAGIEPVSFEMPILSDCTASSGAGPEWYSLPAIPYWGGYLQTLTDVRSDSRCICRYDRKGTFLKATLLNVPIAFVGASKNSELMAVRNLGSTEIVVFRPLRR